MKKKRSMVIVVALILIVAMVGVAFLRNRVETPKGIEDVSTEIYNNGMRIVEMIKNDEISAPMGTEIFSENWSYVLSSKLLEHRYSLYDIFADTDSEITYLAAIYYALCNKYYEKVLDEVISVEELESIDTDYAKEMKSEFTSTWKKAVNAIDSKNMQTIRATIDGIDIEGCIDRFADYFSYVYSESASTSGNPGLGSNLFGLGDDISTGLDDGGFSLQ